VLVSALLPVLVGSPGGVPGKMLPAGCRLGVLVLTLAKGINLLISNHQKFVCILQRLTCCCVTATVLPMPSLHILPLPHCAEQWLEGPVLCAHLLPPASLCGQDL